MKMERQSMHKKRNLFIILGLVLMIGAVAALALLLPKSDHEAPENPEANAYLYIILNNRLWGIEPLNEEREVTVDQGNGVVNVIHLLPGGFYMESSTCDNQLCITEGIVTTQNYQTRFLGPCVYCLPHGLQLELIVPGATRSPDAADN